MYHTTGLTVERIALWALIDLGAADEQRNWALLPFGWAGFYRQLGCTPCRVYVSELRSTGTIVGGTAW